MSANDEREEGGLQEEFQVLPASAHDRWDEFVASCEQASIFHAAWWYRAWGMEPRVHVLSDPQGRIEAGICYCVGRRLGTRAIVVPPLTCCNGPVFTPCKAQGCYKENTYVKKMMLLALHSLPKLGMYDFSLRRCDADVMPFLWNGFDALVHYTHVIPHSHRETWDQHTSKTTRKELRRAAREAEENRCTIDADPSMDEMLPLIRETAEFKNFSFRHCRERLASWWEAVRARGAGRAYLLRDNQGRALASDLFVYDKHTAYSVLGGMRRDLRKGARAGVMLLERMIRDAHLMGLDFDFEGSVLPGVERFMRSFGGELRPAYRVVKIRSPLSYLVWHAHRYLTKHCKGRWIWRD